MPTPPSPGQGETRCPTCTSKTCHQPGNNYRTEYLCTCGAFIFCVAQPRDHSCETCGYGGFNDPDGKCTLSSLAEALHGLIEAAEVYEQDCAAHEDLFNAQDYRNFQQLEAALSKARAALTDRPKGESDE